MVNREGLEFQEPNPQVERGYQGEADSWNAQGPTFHFERKGKVWVAGMWNGLFVNSKMQKLLCFQLKFKVISSNDSEERCLKWRCERALKSMGRMNVTGENRGFCEP